MKKSIYIGLILVILFTSFTGCYNTAPQNTEVTFVSQIPPTSSAHDKPIRYDIEKSVTGKLYLFARDKDYLMLDTSVGRLFFNTDKADKTQLNGIASGMELTVYYIGLINGHRYLASATRLVGTAERKVDGTVLDVSTDSITLDAYEGQFFFSITDADKTELDDLLVGMRLEVYYTELPEPNTGNATRLVLLEQNITGTLFEFSEDTVTIDTYKGRMLFSTTDADKSELEGLETGMALTVRYKGVSKEDDASFARVTSLAGKFINMDPVVITKISGDLIEVAREKLGSRATFSIKNADMSDLENLEVGKYVEIYYKGMLEYVDLSIVEALRLTESDDNWIRGILTDFSAETITLDTDNYGQGAFSIVDVEKNSVDKFEIGMELHIRCRGYTPDEPIKIVKVLEIKEVEQYIKGTVHNVSNDILVLDTHRGRFFFSTQDASTYYLDGLLLGMELDLRYTGILDNNSSTMPNKATHLEGTADRSVTGTVNSFSSDVVTLDTEIGPLNFNITDADKSEIDDLQKGEELTVYYRGILNDAVVTRLVDNSEKRIFGTIHAISDNVIEVSTIARVYTFSTADADTTKLSPPAVSNEIVVYYTGSLNSYGLPYVKATRLRDVPH